MNTHYFRNIFVVFIGAFFALANSYGQRTEEQHIKVAMRMIGHELLLAAKDSTSRILPITQKSMNTYEISFDTEFQFRPEIIVKTIDHVIQTTQIANHYIVELEDCMSKEIVYSYEIATVTKKDIIPCLTREMPKACYQILLTILDNEKRTEELVSTMKSSPRKTTTISNQGNRYWEYTIVGVTLVVCLIGSGFWIKKKKRVEKNEIYKITIGAYEFDKQNMKLQYKDQHTELTSKETDLLVLLHSSVNKTVEREVLLKEVWGDEGDYIGRTLDVYISKLRKKLANDTTIKIINIRGVGYKLIINERE
ncbi:winged helix-turn-helix domain-containing protein [Aquimarina rhabdastrellae]